jgi:hypothetical protein
VAPKAALAPESLPALLELIATSHTSGFLRSRVPCRAG